MFLKKKNATLTFIKIKIVDLSIRAKTAELIDENIRKSSVTFKKAKISYLGHKKRMNHKKLRH